MTLRINILILLFFNFGCKKQANQNLNIENDETVLVTSEYLIEVEDFINIANNPTIKIVDFRKPEFFLKEHIKGAVNIWRNDIENNSYPYKGMMANKFQIEELFSNLGINNDDTIIIYDDNGLCDSSRLWWILQNYDFTNVKLFHGGINSWKLNNGDVSSQIGEIEKSTFKLPKTTSMKYYISKEEMMEAVNRGRVILDTRSQEEFSGKRQKNGAFRGGHIPNSQLTDWSGAINFHGDMKLKSKEELLEIYKNFASNNDTIIAYCHSGVRSAHTTFVLTQLLGYKNVKNYDGSWIEWSYFNDLPIEQDTITTIFN